MRNKNYRNVGAKTKIQTKEPPHYTRVKYFDSTWKPSEDAKLRRIIYEQARKTKAKQPKRFSKWLVFLLRILRINNG